MSGPGAPGGLSSGPIRPTCRWPRPAPAASGGQVRLKTPPCCCGPPCFAHGGHALGCRRQPGIGPASRSDAISLTALLEALKVADVDDRIRSATETLYWALIAAELTATIGAGPHERTEARTAQRNGHRTRTLITTAGDLELRIPKLRSGSFFPSLLERRRRIDQVLFAVVMEAYLHGVSTQGVGKVVLMARDLRQRGT